MNYNEIIKPYLIDFDKLEEGDKIWSVEFGAVEVSIAENIKGTAKIAVIIKEGHSFVGNFHNHLFFTSNPFENLQRIEDKIETLDKQPWASYSNLIAENIEAKEMEAVQYIHDLVNK